MRKLLILSIVILSSCGDSAKTTNSISGDVSEGSTIYNQGLDSQAACIDCHGTDGVGTGATTSSPGSAAITSVDISQASDSTIENAIMFGRSFGSTNMQSYSYSAQEIADVISYIRTL